VANCFFAEVKCNEKSKIGLGFTLLKIVIEKHFSNQKATKKRILNKWAKKIFL